MAEQPSTQAEKYAAVSEQGDIIDLRAYWRVILRRRWIVIPFFVATVVVTALVTLRQTKIYDATCTIIIDLQAPKVLDTQQMQDVVETGAGALYWSREYYETQYKVITSRAVAQRVADKLQLGTNLKFLGLDGVGNAAERERLVLRADPVPLVQRGLKVEPVKDSRIVRIRFEHPDPETAALLANAVAEAYIAENLAVKTSTTQNASEWLEQQLTDLEVKLEKSGRDLFDFKKQHDIVATSWEDRQSMVSQRLTATNEALTRARIQKAQLEARNEAIEAVAKNADKLDGEAESLQPVASSQAIQALKLRYLEAKAECADLKLRYLDKHPKLEACETKVSLARASLQHEMWTLLGAARNEYQEVAKTERNLQALLNYTKADAFGLNQYEREYLELKRTHDNNQRVYEALLKRLKDTGVTGMLQVSNVRVLDRARPGSSPVRPNVGQALLLAIMIGLVGGIALAFGAEYVDTSITTQEQIEEKLGITFLGIIPSIAKNADGTAQDLVVHTNPKSPAAECLRALRTNLLFMSPDKPLRTILVTSSSPQEGKTTTAAALAEVMADSENRVLLVDADMRRPRLHRVFNVPNAAGLSSLILGQGLLDDALKSTMVPGLSVLPCGPVPPNPAELLHTEAFGALLEQLEKRFDRIIIDSPPVAVVADAVVISTRVAGTLMVLKAGVTSRDVAKRAVRALADVNARIFGAVLNDLDLEDQKYGQYYYYYRYGYYYGEKKEEAAS
jgi:capsular exopolysaccharide synthesis family protein